MKSCENCSKPLVKKSQVKYCSLSCAATVNGKRAPKRQKTRLPVACAHCGTPTDNPKFCNNGCQVAWRLAQIDIKLAETGAFESEYVARTYLIRKHGLKCWNCHIDSWCGKELPVVLDHINGHAEDNSLKNLRLLCCNCDAQTDTYKGRNVGKGRHSRLQRYHDGKSY